MFSKAEEGMASGKSREEVEVTHLKPAGMAMMVDMWDNTKEEPSDLGDYS